MTPQLKRAKARVERAAMRWYSALEALEKGEVDERGGSPMENLDEAACEAESSLDRPRRSGQAHEGEEVNLLWDSARRGTAIRVDDHYEAKPPVKKVRRQLTEAEDNAIGRAVRRKQNRRARPWQPYAKR